MLTHSVAREHPGNVGLTTSRTGAIKKWSWRIHTAWSQLTELQLNSQRFVGCFRGLFSHSYWPTSHGFSPTYHGVFTLFSRCSHGVGVCRCFHTRMFLLNWVWSMLFFPRSKNFGAAATHPKRQPRFRLLHLLYKANTGLTSKTLCMVC